MAPKERKVGESITRPSKPYAALNGGPKNKSEARSLLSVPRFSTTLWDEPTAF